MNKINCQICNKKYKGLKGLGQHIVKIHKISTKEYYDKFMINKNETICKRKKCNNISPFLNLSKGYQDYCSQSCSCKISSSGKNNPMYGKKKSKQSIQKQKETVIKKYGVTNAFLINPIYGAVSKKSQNLFNKIYQNLSKELKTKTYYHELNHEFCILRKYRLDFVISSIQICIEFNGDYWHARDTLFNENDIHPQLKLTAKEIRLKEKEKIKAIHKRGLQLLIIWESDYNQNPKQILNNCLNFINEIHCSPSEEDTPGLNI